MKRLEMKRLVRAFYLIGRDPSQFWMGWLSAVIGFILGFVIAHIFF